MPRTLYVARHGLRANEAPPPSGIEGDVRLTDEGLGQAEELGVHLVQVRPAISHIYCSPFWRCLQTVQPGSQKLGLPINVEPGFGEYYHVNRPTHPVPLPAEETKKTFDEIDVSYRRLGVRPPTEGETHETLKERMRNVLDLLWTRVKPDEPVLVMTHAAVKIAIGEVLCGLAPRAGTASLDRYDWDDNTQQWTCVSNGDVSYLSGGEQMHWSFDMAFEAGSAADVASRQTEASETVKLYVPLDFSTAQPGGLKGNSLQVVDLEGDKPLVKVGPNLYEGHWNEIVGSEVYTTPQGDQIGMARHRVTLTPVVSHQPGAAAAKSQRLVDRLQRVELERSAEAWKEQLGHRSTK